jgi:hypothetical protein
MREDIADQRDDRGDRCLAADAVGRPVHLQQEDTVTIAPTVPQTVARITWSTLNAAKTLPRAMTRRQASHAPANFSAAGAERRLSNAQRDGIDVARRTRRIQQAPVLMRSGFGLGADPDRQRGVRIPTGGF